MATFGETRKGKGKLRVCIAEQLRHALVVVYLLHRDFQLCLEVTILLYETTRSAAVIEMGTWALLVRTDVEGMNSGNR